MHVFPLRKVSFIIYEAIFNLFFIFMTQYICRTFSKLQSGLLHSFQNILVNQAPANGSN